MLTKSQKNRTEKRTILSALRTDTTTGGSARGKSQRLSLIRIDTVSKGEKQNWGSLGTIGERGIQLSNQILIIMPLTTCHLQPDWKTWARDLILFHIQEPIKVLQGCHKEVLLKYVCLNHTAHRVVKALHIIFLAEQFNMLMPKKSCREQSQHNEISNTKSGTT